jgi:ribosomal protein S18 acetylase RimI-like enzyme
VASSTPRFTIEVLGKGHRRDDFDCGSEPLDRYLRTQARQDMERGVAIVYVSAPSDAPTRVAGYYSLSSTAVRLAEWPEPTRRKLPRYPLVPATLIGRLAVDRRHRGLRLGERLLIDALRRSLAASETVASVAVVVDAKDETGVAFYRRYGFIAFPDQPLRLFLPMKTIARLVTS